jgi:phenolphthiocerol/phthiocerol/phthiodiolone dimycocerosyl transferase
VFPTSVIRKLAHSEEVFAKNETFFGLTVHTRGPVDVECMSAAFDTLLEAHPVLTGRLERDSEGWHHIVAEDLLHPGIWLVSGDSGSPQAATRMKLDQGVSLVNLLLRLDEDRAAVTLYVHHSLADGHHVFGLLDELFGWYTELVTVGSVGPVTPQPAPESLEAVLEQRAITKQQRSGLERLIRVIFAYELPPRTTAPLSADPVSTVMVPVARRRLTEQQTADLHAYCRTNGLSLNTVVAAAILLAEWRLRGTPHIPIPYLYPVDLRHLLTPPVDATACTNPVGVATYLAEIGPATEIADLARDITDTFRADLSDGVIQQSTLHFTLQYEGSPPGLPPMVLCTDVGPVPVLPTPDNLELTDFQSELLCLPRAPVDFYGCGTFADRLFIEHHSHAPGREDSLEEIVSLLCSVPAEDGWDTE